MKLQRDSYISNLAGKFKLWSLQSGFYPILLWQPMMYEVEESRVKRILETYRAYIRKWLGLAKCLNNSAL